MAKNVIYVPSCHSTNLLAEQLLAEDDIFDGTVIATGEQTNGKGRLDRTWESRKGENILLSVILRPSFLDLDFQFFLNIFSSLAVANTIENLSGIRPEIKWPNDVMVNGRKISGILIKNVLRGKSISNSIVGIGINVNQIKFENSNAVSLKNISGRHHNLEEVFRILMRNLEKYYLLLRDLRTDKLSDHYHNILYGKDREIVFESDGQFTGIIRGVDRKGHLVVEKGGEKMAYNLNEIKYISQPI